MASDRETVGRRRVPRRASDFVIRGFIRRAPGLCTWLAWKLADRHFSRRRKRAALLRANFATAFPQASEAELNGLVRRFGRSYYQTWVEQEQLDFMTPGELTSYVQSHVTTHGAEHLMAACEARTPVIVFSPHFGHFALATLRVASMVRGRKDVFFFFNAPEKNPYAPRIKALLEAVGFPNASIHNDKPGVLKAFRGLKKGGLLGMMPDVVQFDPSALFVPFFGYLTMAMAGTAFFARKTGARLLPLYCERVGRDRYCLEIEAPIALRDSGDSEQDLYEMTAEIFASMECRLRRRPEQWMYWESFSARLAAGVRLPDEPTGWLGELERLQSASRGAGRPLEAFMRELCERAAAGVPGEVVEKGAA